MTSSTADHRATGRGRTHLTGIERSQEIIISLTELQEEVGHILDI